MRTEQPEQDKLFQRVKAGNGAALLDLLESERGALFDYLLRLTGQVSRSIETTDEVFLSLNGEQVSSLQTYAELKVCIYATARRFNADIWNADTSRLVNAALTQQKPTAMEGEAPKVVDPRAASLLDRSVRGLPGPQREALLLTVVADFDPAEAAQVMGLSANLVEALLQAAFSAVGHDVFSILGPVEKALRGLIPHPMPVRSSHMTVNLGAVMQGIKTTHVVWTPVRVATLVMLLGFGTYCWFYPQAVAHVMAFLRSTWRGGMAAINGR